MRGAGTVVFAFPVSRADRYASPHQPENASSRIWTVFLTGPGIILLRVEHPSHARDAHPSPRIFASRDVLPRSTKLRLAITRSSRRRLSRGELTSVVSSIRRLSTGWVTQDSAHDSNEFFFGSASLWSKRKGRECTLEIKLQTNIKDQFDWQKRDQKKSAILSINTRRKLLWLPQPYSLWSRQKFMWIRVR